MGPLLLARLLDLNATQTGILTLVFKVADDQGLLLLDLKDLQAMIRFVGDNAKEFHDIWKHLLSEYRCHSTLVADPGTSRCRGLFWRAGSESG